MLPAVLRRELTGTASLWRIAALVTLQTTSFHHHDGHRRRGLETGFVLQAGLTFPANPLDLVERKGFGHPDKLADDLAEELSREYANATLDACGAVLHHNFDKLCLLGGAAEVRFGDGRVIRPIRVLVNGRAAMSFAGRSLHVNELLESTCREFLARRLPLLNVQRDVQVELNLSTASSPGGVLTQDDARNARHHWFSPRSLTDLPELAAPFANDTSFGSAYAPKSTIDRVVKELGDYLSDPGRVGRPAWMGTDVKVMGCGADRRLDIVACVPQIAGFVPSAEAYGENLSTTEARCMEFLADAFPDVDATLVLNARDRPQANEYYLTAIGSSLESGDEGVVGRGNRLNGLITPLRPMSLEGVNGKNPVYHVGKIYNIVAAKLAQRLHDEHGGTVYVNLASATGRPLAIPWRVIVQMEASAPHGEVERVAEEVLGDIPSITRGLLAGRFELS